MNTQIIEDHKFDELGEQGKVSLILTKQQVMGMYQVCEVGQEVQLQKMELTLQVKFSDV